MNCSGCGQGNRDEARFCQSCGEALAQRCSRCTAKLSAGHRFCDDCGLRLERAAPPARSRSPRDYTPKHLAERILTSKHALEGEHKHVTVLFVDVWGSMELAASVDPESWHRIMDRFFHVLSDGIHRFEGTINQFTGDGIMALFGAPIAHEDHAQRACYAALHLRDELGHYSEKLKRAYGLAFSVRMGLNSGEVVVGTIGDDLRMDYTAQGHMVGIAARMEQLADPGTIYLNEGTAALVRDFFELGDLGNFDIKGVARPARVFQLKDAGRVQTRLDAARARGFSRFVGRAEEMRILETTLDRALTGSGQVVGVVADAGVGKSRLCFEFVQRCRARGILVREAHGVPHGKMIPFRPVLEMLRGFFAIAEGDGDAEARRKIAGSVLLLDSELTPALPLLFDFLGVPDPDHPVPRLDPEARQNRLLHAVTRLVQALSEQRPAVLLIEDLHWLDAGSEAFFRHLVDTVINARIFVLVNFRSDHQADWMQKSYYHPLPLLPLGEVAIRELLDDLLGDDESVRELAEPIRQHAGGNPFFIEEIVQSLIDSGQLEGSREAYRLVRPIQRLAVPPTVQALLASRIDRLSDVEKQVIQTAAVIGKQFSEPLLRRVMKLSDDVFGEALLALCRSEFIYEQSLYPVGEYAFKHPLTQEVAYASQLAENRGRIHAATARAIEELQPDKLGEHAALLAHHAEAAGDALEAAVWHQRAAEWVGVSDIQAAHRHWRAVMALLKDAGDSVERTALALTARVWMLQLAWRLGFSESETEETYRTGMALAERSEEPASVIMLKLGYSIYRAVIGDEKGQDGYGREAARLADQLGDHGLALAARCVIATSLHFRGHLNEGIKVADWAMENTEEPSEGGELFWLSPYTYLLGLRGALHSLSGRLAEGEGDIGRALELARRGNDPETLGCIHVFHVQHDRCSGDGRSALSHGSEVVEIAERIGIPLLLVDAYLALGSAHLLRGEWTQAIAALEHALGVVEGHGIMVGQRPRVLVALAEAHQGSGNDARALEIADGLLATPHTASTLLVALGAQLVRGRALLNSEGDQAADAICTAIEAAFALVEQSGARSVLPATHLLLADVARRAEKTEAREHQLRTAKLLYAEMGATAHAEGVETSRAPTSC